MSNILDALRDAQAQRHGRQGELDFDATPPDAPPPPPPREPRLWPWLLLAALVGLAAAWAWFAFGPSVTVVAHTLAHCPAFHG